MSGTEFLIWVRGPGLNISLAIFAFGMVLKFFEIFMLGRKKNLAELRSSGVAEGFKTIVLRTGVVDKFTTKRTIFTQISGWVFHIGLFISLFFLAAHIELFKSLFGFGWPALPTPVVDFFTVLALISLVAILWHRISNPVLRFLTTGQDYLVWALTFLPLLTGYLAYHHLFVPYTWMLAFHILSVELLLIAFPFTKLNHAFTLFISRYYNGMMAGQKGVQS